MASNLYITATESRSGKSAIVLGVMQMLLRDIRRVGFFRPIINDESERKDHDIDLVLSQFYLGLQYQETYALTMRQAKELVNAGQHSLLIEKIINKYKELESKCDFVLLEGTDFEGTSPAFEFDINADIAANLGSPLLVISNACQKTEHEIISSTKLAVESFADKAVDIMGVVINRTDVPDREALRIALRKSMNKPDMLLYIIPEVAILGKPTVGDVMKWVGAEVLYGKENLGAQVDDIVVAAMQIENFLNYIERGSLVVTPGDRSDIIVSSLASRQSSSYPDISGILLTGGIAPGKAVARLIDGWTGVPVPVLLGKEAVRLRADDGTHMGRAEIAVDGKLRVIRENTHGNGDRLVGSQNIQVFNPARGSREDSAGNGRCRGFETDPQENDSLFWILPSKGQSIQGRVDDPDVCSQCSFLHQVGS